MHNIPEETTEGLKTYSEEDLCNDTELQRIQNELHVAEAQLKEAKPNLKIIEVKINFVLLTNYLLSNFLGI